MIPLLSFKCPPPQVVVIYLYGNVDVNRYGWSKVTDVILKPLKLPSESFFTDRHASPPLAVWVKVRFISPWIISAKKTLPQLDKLYPTLGINVRSQHTSAMFPGGYLDLVWSGGGGTTGDSKPISRGNFSENRYPFLGILPQKHTNFSQFSGFPIKFC